MLYVDTSIRFKSGEISEIAKTCKETGLLTQFIGLRFNCYTNPAMFDWFNENPDSYEHLNTIEANILFFTNNFVTSLVMKAWVTCALGNFFIITLTSYYQTINKTWLNK